MSPGPVLILINFSLVRHFIHCLCVFTKYSIYWGGLGNILKINQIRASAVMILLRIIRTWQIRDQNFVKTLLVVTQILMISTPSRASHIVSSKFDLRYIFVISACCVLLYLVMLKQESIVFFYWNMPYVWNTCKWFDILFKRSAHIFMNTSARITPNWF